MTMILERATELHFVEPLPGFDGEENYTLSAIDPDGVLYSLRSVSHPELRFVLTPANTFFADYTPDVQAVLEGTITGEVDVLLMLTLGAGLSDATANLRAPIAVSATTGQALQVVLEDDSLPMSYPLVPALAA